MAIISKPEPPDQASSLVQARIKHQTQAHKVYVLGLQELVANAVPGEQYQVGWRFVTDIAPDMAIAGDVTQTAATQPPSFAGLSYGPEIAKSLQAIHRIETLATVPDGEFELGLLSIPGLLVDAFWLRSLNATGDLVVPYDTSAEGIRELHVYQVGAFLDIIRPLARERLSELESLS
jgi:hypothetical protein